jgi:hypothetical protein
MSRDEIIERANKENSSSKQILAWMSTMNLNSKEPIKYKKGDVFSFNLSSKPRPYVIIKQVKELIISIPLTTCKDELSVHFYNSRFMGQGYFSNQLLAFKESHIKDNFIGVLDDTKNINIAFKQIVEYYKNI